MSKGSWSGVSQALRIDTVVPHRFRALDGYRAIAALAVVTTHVAYFTGIVVSTPWGHAFSRMDFGVTIFFLLSGFLLFRPWSMAALAGKRRPTTRTYLRRRLWRILPAYLVLVIVVLAVMPGIDVQLKHWVAHLTLTQIYWPDLLVNGLTQTWSLATEMSFYLVLPAVGLWVGLRHRGDADKSTRRQLVVLLAWMALAAVWLLMRTLTAASALPVLGMWLPNFLDWFAVGMFFALVHNRLQLPHAPRWMRGLNNLADDPAVCLFIAGALFLLATTPIAGGYSFGEGSASQAIARHYLYSSAAGALLLPGFLGTQGWGQWRQFLESPLMTYLGTISYGIFLWHLFVLETGSRIMGLDSFTGWFWLLWPMTIVGTIALAHISYVLVERPAQRHSHRPASRTHAIRRPTRGPTETPAALPSPDQV